MKMGYLASLVFIAIVITACASNTQTLTPTPTDFVFVSPTRWILPFVGTPKPETTTATVQATATQEATQVLFPTSVEQYFYQTPTGTEWFLPDYFPQPTLVHNELTSEPTQDERTEPTNPTAEMENTPEANTNTSPLYADKGDGFWRIGIDIAPGYWEYKYGGDPGGCLVRIFDHNGHQRQSREGDPGGGVYLDPSDYQFTSLNCGTWGYVGSPDLY